MHDKRSWKTLLALLILLVASPGTARAVSTVLQPSSQDAYLRQDKPNHVYGSGPTLTRIFVMASPTINKRRGLVQFDLPIPQFSTVTSAVLELNQQSAVIPAHTHGVYKVLSSWLQSTVKWNTTPTAAAAPTATAIVGTVRGFKSFTVTPDVQAWVNTPTTNFGWLVKDQAETVGTDEVGYVSREDAHIPDIPNRPKLTVNFNPPACTTNAQCADSNLCTANERCQGGFCVVDPVSCDDSNACTDDICDPQQGCLNPIGECNDGFSCTIDNCDPMLGCTHTAVPSVCLHGGCQTGTCVADPDDPTLDPVTGCLVSSVAPNGTSCNADNSLCTQNDTCLSGECIPGAPVTCGPPGQCENAGTCNPGTGTCTYPPKPNGTGCNDGDACTQTDACNGSGTCVGGNPVVCTPLDQCHVAGTCNTGTGLCTNPNAPNGSACSDGNACTTGDQCTGGACDPGTPTICTPLDQCHVAGTCDTGSGVCSNPNAPNGTGCNDGDACTQTDTCTGGSCGGGNPVVCTPLDQCHDTGTCDTGTGLCSNPQKPNGTSCSDGNACTINDVCTAGTCGGSSMTCGDNVVQPSCGEDCDAGPGGGGDCSATCKFLCGPTPRNDCVLGSIPNKARLIIKNRTPDKRDLLVWKVTKVNTVLPPQLGDPLTTTGYRLCIWDGSGNPQPRYRAQVAPGGTCGVKPCWKAVSNGDKFKDRDGSQNGTQLILLKAGPAPKPKAQWKGKRENLQPPALPLTTNVTVQLENDAGTCWSTTFSTPLANTAEQFKAKGN